MKTAIAMKICDTLGVGGSYSEIVVTITSTAPSCWATTGPSISPFRTANPSCEAMGVYHGKKGTGVSVEAKVKSGPVTTLGLTQGRDGRFKLIISEGTATDDEIMKYRQHPNARGLWCRPRQLYGQMVP